MDKLQGWDCTNEQISSSSGRVAILVGSLPRYNPEQTGRQFLGPHLEKGPHTHEKTPEPKDHLVDLYWVFFEEKTFRKESMYEQLLQS